MNTIKQDKTSSNFSASDNRIMIAHIIHPVIVPDTSDLVIAQPITFATMDAARKFADKSIDVDLFAVQHGDEERIALPDSFIRTRDLTRSVGDVASFRKKRKLALIKDILDVLYESSSADYLIYTNVDIALQPYFYRVVGDIIRQGHDAFIINRRTIPGHYKNTEDVPLMYAEIGEKHPGWDCFVFKRDLYPMFMLGNVCIGTDWIGRMMIANIASLAKKFMVFTDLQMTFHIGDDRIWKNDDFSDYAAHNKEESRKTLMVFDQKYGPFDRKGLPGRFLNHFEEIQSEKAGMTKNKIINNIVFVGGPSRGGTTFAARALNLHPRFISAIDDHVYECWGLYQYRRRCGLVQEMRTRKLLQEEARKILADYLFADDCLVGVASSDKIKNLSLVAKKRFHFLDSERSVLDNKLLRYSMPLSKFSNKWRLCLKSPEISFVLPQLADFFPYAKFVLVYRPIIEIAVSMYRMGNLVKKFSVYQRRWIGEKNKKGDLIPPPGVPSEWNVLWQTVSDFQRCVIYAASYVSALLFGIEKMDPDRYFIYNHNHLRIFPRQVFQPLAKFLSVDASGFQVAEAELKENQNLISTQCEAEYFNIENELSLGKLMNKIESICLSNLRIDTDI